MGASGAISNQHSWQLGNGCTSQVKGIQEGYQQHPSHDDNLESHERPFTLWFPFLVTLATLAVIPYMLATLTMLFIITRENVGSRYTWLFVFLIFSLWCFSKNCHPAAKWRKYGNLLCQFFLLSPIKETMTSDIEL